jgi:hypothetical protein
MNHYCLHVSSRAWLYHPNKCILCNKKSIIYEISLGVTPNLISTRKTEIFCGTQKCIVHPTPFQNKDGVPKTHQVYYLSDIIRVITLI